MYAQRAVTRTPPRAQNCKYQSSRSLYFQCSVCSALSIVSLHLRFDWCSFNYLIVQPTAYLNWPSPNICITVVNGKRHKFAFSFANSRKICWKFASHSDGDPTVLCLYSHFKYFKIDYQQLQATEVVVNVHNTDAHDRIHSNDEHLESSQERQWTLVLQSGCIGRDAL